MFSRFGGFGMLPPLVLLLAGLAAPVPVTAQAAAPDGPAVARPGDTIRVFVWNRQELSGSFPVAADGTLHHPLYRGVAVAGLSAPEVYARVGETLARYQASPQYVVDLLLRVSLAGEVVRPGLYALPAGTTVEQAVALAGGLTPYGHRGRVRLMRGAQTAVVDLAAPANPAGAQAIRSGDQILVPRRTNVFREYVAPAAGIVAALGTLINLVINARRS